MSELLKKSADNTSAAELLFTNNYYNCSIHCSYYSCLQIMKYVMISQFGFTEAEFEPKKGSHLNIISYYKGKQSKLIMTMRDFSKIIDELQGMRVEAEYKNKLYDSVSCDNALKKSKKFCNDFRRFYKI